MITVLLAEDQHLVRGALAALLDLENDIEVIAQVASGEQIVPAAIRSRPDVAIIDVNLPVLDGISAAQEMRTKLPECRTLIVTGLAGRGALHRALAAGVGGYVLKDAPSDQLAEAVREVASGRTVVDHQLAITALRQSDCPLSDRQLEVLRLAAKGADTRDIAARLFLSVGTVRNYLTTATGKLDARNRVDAIRIASEAGWL